MSEGLSIGQQANTTEGPQQTPPLSPTTISSSLKRSFRIFRLGHFLYRFERKSRVETMFSGDDQGRNVQLPKPGEPSTGIDLSGARSKQNYYDKFEEAEPNSSALSHEEPENSEGIFLPIQTPNQDDSEQSKESDFSLIKLAYEEPDTSLPSRSPAELTGAIILLREDSEHQIAHFNEQIAQKEIQLAQADAEVKRLRDSNNDLDRRRREAVRSLARGVRSDPYLLDDHYFEREVDTLRWNVEQWVRNRTWQLHDAGNFIGHENVLQRTTPYFEDYLNTLKGTQTFLEARLWQHLTRLVFGKGVWAEINYQKEFNDNPYLSLRENLNKYANDGELWHEWRAVTARIMASREPVSTQNSTETAILRIAGGIWSDFEFFWRKGSEKHNQVMAHLKTLIDGAIKLDASMQQQRSHLSLHPSLKEDLDLNFVPRYMVAFNEDGGKASMPGKKPRKVTLLRAPGLRKLGTSTGKSFDRESMILKAVVDVERRRP